MYHKIKKELTFPDLNKFNFEITYSEINRKNQREGTQLHSHNKFEIYINLSGDVSFLVENKLYPLTHGDVIIARPNEYHHCIHRSDAQHKHFWILFECNNSSLMDFMYHKPINNYISPTEDLKNELTAICFKMLNQDLSEQSKFYNFFRLLEILKISTNESLAPTQAMPDDIMKIITYIDNHIAENITLNNLSKNLFISISTLERKFKNHLNIKPLDFIRKKKLIAAANLLRNGESVLNAGLNVGYSDNSYFIKLFKQQYGITPYKYKKLYNGIG